MVGFYISILGKYSILGNFRRSFTFVIFALNIKGEKFKGGKKLKTNEKSRLPRLLIRAKLQRDDTGTYLVEGEQFTGQEFPGYMVCGHYVTDVPTGGSVYVTES